MSLEHRTTLYTPPLHAWQSDDLYFFIDADAHHVGKVMEFKANK